MKKHDKEIKAFAEDIFKIINKHPHLSHSDVVGALDWIKMEVFLNKKNQKSNADLEKTTAMVAEIYKKMCDKNDI